MSRLRATRSREPRSSTSNSGTAKDPAHRTSDGPSPSPDRVDQLLRCDVSEIPIGGREARVAELRLDEVRWQPLGCQLGGVGVAEAVGVDALLYSGLACETRQQGANVGVLERRSAERTEDALTTVEAQLAPPVQPAVDKGEGTGIDAGSIPAATTEWDRLFPQWTRIPTTPKP